MKKNIMKPIKLIKNTFYNERETKTKLEKFIRGAKILSMGEECKKFENNFSTYYNRKFTTLVNSGSSANIALIQALINLGTLSIGDSVGFSAVTWSTNVMPLIQLGLKPTPIDIDLKTLNVNSDDLIKAFKKNKIKAFFITNLLGFCGDIENIARFCEDNNIILLEDNCESFGTVYKNKKLGNYSLASTFSFFVGHHLSTIEGGAICTDDEKLNDMLIIVRAHGWDRSLNKEKQIELRKKHSVDSFYDQYTFYDVGYNLRPTEITGFLGSHQLQFADDMIAKRQKNFLKFHSVACANNDFLHLEVDQIEYISNFAYPILCKNKIIFNKYKYKFLSNRVEIRPIVGGNMVKQPFFKKYNSKPYNLPNADFVHDCGFYFPNNPQLTSLEVKKINSLLKK